jgi:ferrous iron transport protein B
LEGDRQISDLLKRDPPLGEQIQTICNATYKHTINTLEEDPEGIIADHRYGFIAGITKKAVKRKIELRLNLSDKTDKVLTNRVVGPVFMAVVLYAIYAFTFWISEVPLVWFESLFGIIRHAVSSVLPEGILKSMVVSGIIDGVGGVLSFVPLIMFMFFAIAILEDSGYMARIAYMMDRVLRWFGLHGNSVMALIVSGGISGGCAVPGIMATRTLKDPKERLATLMVVPFMNCGAKLPVYAMLIGAFFVKYQARMMFILTILSWCFALFAAKFMRASILRGPKTPFVMELPPYRLPTLKGLLIHTWERTWHYIKKAGTVILAFSILLWAMMTFPGLPDEAVESFERNRKEFVSEFLSDAHVKGLISNRNQVEDLNRLYELYHNKKVADEISKSLKPETGRLVPLIEAAIGLKDEETPKEAIDTVILKAAYRYLDLRKNLDNLERRKQQSTLEGTFAGRMGLYLEPITKPLGFDYKTNIALIGGFAAKEVIISTLGTAYSLGELEADKTVSLSQKLRNNPDWDPLLAFTLIVFIMLYVPCFVTLLCIKKESSFLWALFSVAFNLCAAYFVALVIRQGGLALGIGL